MRIKNMWHRAEKAEGRSARSVAAADKEQLESGSLSLTHQYYTSHLARSIFNIALASVTIFVAASFFNIHGYRDLAFALRFESLNAVIFLMALAPSILLAAYAFYGVLGFLFGLSARAERRAILAISLYAAVLMLTEALYSNKFRFDEVFYIPAGLKYVSGVLPSTLNPEHPPLAKYLIGFASTLGGVPYGARSVAVLLGIGVILFSYLTAKRSLNNTKIALLTPIVLVSNFFFLATMASGWLEPYVLFFTTMALYIAASRESPRSTLLAGVSMGAAVASKWLAAPFWIGFAAFYAYQRNFKRLLLFAASSIGTYTLTYVPVILSQGFLAFLQLQIEMLQFHITGQAPAGFPADISRALGVASARNPGLFVRPIFWFLGFREYFYLAEYVRAFVFANVPWFFDELLTPLVYGAGLLSTFYVLSRRLGPGTRKLPAILALAFTVTLFLMPKKWNFYMPLLSSLFSIIIPQALEVLAKPTLTKLYASSLATYSLVMLTMIGPIGLLTYLGV